MTSYVEIILEATMYRVFSYSFLGVVFESSILSSSQKLADADPAGTLASCFGTQNEQKYVQKTVIEVEIRALST